MTIDVLLAAGIVVRDLVAGTQLVQPSADWSAHQRSQNWHQEVDWIRIREYFPSVDDESEEARSEVSGRIDGISNVVTEGTTDHHDDKTEEKRVQTPRNFILLIEYRRDEETEDSGADELIKECSLNRQIVWCERSENPRRSILSYCHTNTSIEIVNGVDIEEVCSQRSHESARRLRRKVHSSSDRVYGPEGEEHQGNRRIYVPSRALPRCENTESDSKTPAHVDVDPDISSSREMILSHDALANED